MGAATSDGRTSGCRRALLRLALLTISMFVACEVRTAALFGVPVRAGGAQRFAVGGALGNALLLAMLTARPS